MQQLYTIFFIILAIWLISCGDGLSNRPLNEDGESFLNNIPPIADAGSDQEIALGDTVVLDGSKSRDSDSFSLVYSWHQIAGPPVTLSDSTALQPTFIPEITGVYIFDLTVSDGMYLFTGLRVKKTPLPADLQYCHEIYLRP